LFFLCPAPHSKDLFFSLASNTFQSRLTVWFSPPPPQPTPKKNSVPPTSCRICILLLKFFPDFSLAFCAVFRSLLALDTSLRFRLRERTLGFLLSWGRFFGRSPLFFFIRTTCKTWHFGHYRLFPPPPKVGWSRDTSLLSLYFHVGGLVPPKFHDFFFSRSMLAERAGASFRGPDTRLSPSLFSHAWFMVFTFEKDLCFPWLVSPPFFSPFPPWVGILKRTSFSEGEPPLLDSPPYLRFSSYRLFFICSHLSFCRVSFLLGFLVIDLELSLFPSFHCSGEFPPHMFFFSRFHLTGRVAFLGFGFFVPCPQRSPSAFLPFDKFSCFRLRKSPLFFFPLFYSPPLRPDDSCLFFLAA